MGQTIGIPDACPELKENYSKCEAKWYKDGFVKGNLDNPCRLEWEAYRTCVNDFVGKKLFTAEQQEEKKRHAQQLQDELQRQQQPEKK